MLPKYFFCPPPPSQSRYFGVGPASPTTPFLPKPSRNSPMVEKRKGKRQSKRAKRLYPFFQLNANFKKYFDTSNYSIDENIIPEVECRTLGSRPRTALPRTEPLEAKNRNAQGQGPRTQTQVIQKVSSRTPALHDTIL